jgi:ATP-dependent DNA ligase
MPNCPSIWATAKDLRKSTAPSRPVDRAAEQKAALAYDRERQSRPKATWVEPAFVAEVEYRDITSDGLLRASSFKGLTKA